MDIYNIDTKIREWKGNTSKHKERQIEAKSWTQKYPECYVDDWGF